MQQGVDKQINLGGIVRNTAGSTCPDGEMEEIINLRYKDGSLRPISDNKPVLGLENKEIPYTNIVIHTCSYRHWIGVKDGKLWYFANQGGEDNDNGDEEEMVRLLNSPIELCNISGTPKYSQTGNLLTVIDNSGIKYQYWKRGEYVDSSVGYNGKQTDVNIPPFSIDFRIAPKTQDGEPLIRYFTDDSQKMDLSPAGNGFSNTSAGRLKWKNWLVQDAQINARREVVNSLILKNLQLNREEGYIDGFFFICAAVKLYDGNYTLMNNPILLCSGNDLGLRYDNVKEPKTYKSDGSVYAGGGTFSYDKNPYAIKVNHDVTHDFSIEQIDYDLTTEYKTYSFKRTHKELTLGIKTKLSSVKYGGYYSYKNSSYAEQLPPIYAGLETDGSLKYPRSYSALNNIEFRVNYISNLEEDIYKSIDIFISKPVTFSDYTANDLIEILGCSRAYEITTKEININENAYIYEVKSNEKIIKELESSLKTFYKIYELPIQREITKQWETLIPEEGVFNNLETQQELNYSAINRASIFPAVSYNFNGKLHLANYKEEPFYGWPLNYFSDYRTTSNVQFSLPSPITLGVDGTLQEKFNKITNGNPFLWRILVVVDKKSGTQEVIRYCQGNTMNFYGLNMLSYPDTRATKMVVSLVTSNAVFERTFDLTASDYLNCAYYISDDMKPINIDNKWVAYAISNLTDGYYQQTIDNLLLRYPNQMKVSAVNNPLYFPDANTYQVGNVEILELSSNTIDLSTGQIGESPLYVFAQDGIYGLFVDSSGVMTYSNSRPLARDILNNVHSVLATDSGVVFTTDRGLMMIAGAQVVEIGQAAEGKFLDFTNTNSFDNLPVAANAINHAKLVELDKYKTDCEFKEYLKDAIMGYNFNEYELWVTNPNKTYTYIYSFKTKGWVKRSISCTQYINNYPQLYMLNDSKRIIDINNELASGNETMFLTRPIKFNSQAFKQSYRSVIRGLFDLPELKDSNRIVDITPADDALMPTIREIELTEDAIRTIEATPFAGTVREIELTDVPLTPIVVKDKSDSEISFTKRDLRKVAFYDDSDFIADEMRTINVLDEDAHRLLPYQSVTVSNSSVDIELITRGIPFTMYGGVGEYIELTDNTGQQQSGVYKVYIKNSGDLMPEKISFSELVSCSAESCAIEKVSDSADIDSITFDVSKEVTYLGRNYMMWDAITSINHTVFIRKHIHNGEELGSCEYTYTELATLLQSDGTDYTKYKGATNIEKQQEMERWLHCDCCGQQYIASLLPKSPIKIFYLDIGFMNIIDDVDGETILKRNEDQMKNGISQYHFIFDRNFMVSRDNEGNKPTYDSLCITDLLYSEYDEFNSLFKSGDEKYKESFYYVYKDIINNYRYGFERTRDDNGIIEPKKREITKGMYRFYSDGNDMGYRYLTENYSDYEYALYDKIEAMAEFNAEYGQELVETGAALPFTDGEEVIVWLAEEDSNVDIKDGNTFHAIKYADITNGYNYSDFSENIEKYEKAEIAEPTSISLSIGDCYLIRDNLNGLEWKVVAPSNMAITYSSLMLVIDTWQKWYYQTDYITLTNNECYTLNWVDDYDDDGVTPIEQSESFQYIGEGVVMTAADIISGVTANNSDYQSIPSFYPESVTVNEGEYIKIILTSGGTLECKYTGNSGSIDTQTLVQNIARGVYYMPQVADQEGVIKDDIFSMVNGEKIKFTDLNGNTTQFVYVGREKISYSTLVANINADKYQLVANFGEQLLYLNQYDCVHLVVNYANNTQQEFLFQYLIKTTPITLNDLLNKINSEYAYTGDIPSVNGRLKLYIPFDKIISFSNGGTNYLFTVKINTTNGLVWQGGKDGFYYTYDNLLDTLTHYDNEMADENGYRENDFIFRKSNMNTASGFRAGIYLFGSYDCRSWKFIGGNEVGDIDGAGSVMPNAMDKNGNVLFRDLGALTERLDCKYFRICFVGNLLPDSTIEYIDMSVESRLLQGKLR